MSLKESQVVPVLGNRVKYLVTLKELQEFLQSNEGQVVVTVESISDATTIGKELLEAEDAAAVRSLIGAGTSSLTIGTTATTALAGNTSLLTIGTTATTAASGNHNHAIVADTESGLTAASNLREAFVALATRVRALELAQPEGL